MSRDPLDLALAGLEEAARELATQCYQWDQLARELWEELDKRYVPGGPHDWMGYYVERLRRYAPKDLQDMPYKPCCAANAEDDSKHSVWCDKRFK